jgi:hypothetical protein
MSYDYEHCESLYWVFTQRCNDACAHCYNMSGPNGATLSLAECMAIVGNLPERIDRLILSGGEPLVELEKLRAILDALAPRRAAGTQLMLQTNGDLLTPELLDELLGRGITRIDVASIDRLHRERGERRERLAALFRSRGMQDDATEPLVSRDDYLKRGASFGFWGATDDVWLGGNWPRGRALATGLWRRDGDHNFCAILSGARGFLGGTELPQEIAVQLWRVHPCCPGTAVELGDARRERVADVLRVAASDPAWQRLNEGDAYGIGESVGVSAEHGHRRARELGSVCLWCDEFFARHRGSGGHGSARG